VAILFLLAGYNLDYDVALVRLRSTRMNPYIEFNDYVQPACLPASFEGDAESYYSTETLCEVVGWTSCMICIRLLSVQI